MSADIHQLTREQLYEKAWSAPATTLAKEFGISDVAIAKRCKKLNVPKPSLGYWRKVELGQKPKKTPLPPVMEDPSIKEIQKPIPKNLALPAETDPLLPLAADLLKAIEAGKPRSDQRVELHERALPETRITKESGLRAVRMFHVLLQTVVPRGIPFCKTRGRSEGGYFLKDHDRLYLKIEEKLVVKEPVGRRRSYGWYDTRVPGGMLSFEFSASKYGATAAQWTEGGKMLPETMMAEMAAFVCRHYAEIERRRKAEAIESAKRHAEWLVGFKQYQEREALRQQAEEKRKHAEALETAARERKDDLLKAAEWWRLNQSVNGFAQECERRWREAQDGNLTPEQQAWLTWAQAEAKALSPFEAGYPEPSMDGAFDPEAVPFGGPYPKMRKFPRPPTMPEALEPVVVKEKQVVYQPAREPYPFWLRHQGR